MVLKITKVTGNGRYYTDQQAEYHISGTEPNGVWYDPHGVGHVSHGSDIDNDQFLMAVSGYHPTNGVKLSQNVNRDDRVAGYALTFSTPKSVSVMWALGDYETRDSIERAQHIAVERSLDHVGESTVIRRGRGGHDIREAHVFGAVFQHGDARPDAKGKVGDPQLHTHAVIFNAGHDGEKWATLDGRPLLNSVKEIGHFYHKELARELGREGFSIEHQVGPDANGLFQIRGVPTQLMDHFSSRRQQIIDKAKDHEFDPHDKTNGRRLDGVAWATRYARNPNQLTDRHSIWAEQARDLGYEPSRVIEQAKDIGRDQLVSVVSSAARETSIPTRDIAQDLMIEQESLERIQTALADKGLNQFKVVGGGSESIVMAEKNNDTVVVRLQPAGKGIERIPSEHILQPLAKGYEQGIAWEVMPKADTRNITRDEVRELQSSLKDEGIRWTDSGTDQVGRYQGRLVALDPGNMEKGPSYRELVDAYRESVLHAVKQRPGTPERATADRDRYERAAAVVEQGASGELPIREQRILSTDAEMGRAMREVMSLVRAAGDDDGYVRQARARVLATRRLDGREDGNDRDRGR